MTESEARHRNALMNKIVEKYGDDVRMGIAKYGHGLADSDDLKNEILFAVFTAAYKNTGEDISPNFSRSYVYGIIRHKVNDRLRNKYRQAKAIEAFKKREAECIKQWPVAHDRFNALSRAEFDVFRLLGLGLSNEDIAEELFISRNTIRSHLKNTYRKTGIDNRALLAIIASRLCWSGPGLFEWRPMEEAT